MVFTNYGRFIPKSVEDVVLHDSPEEYYRNPFLVEAMRKLGMIETQGGGIRKVFNFQKQRFFPLPEYNLSENKVKVTITGKVINEEFAKILINNPEITLEDIILLDKVQKQVQLSLDELKYLRSKKFIEGRRNGIFLSHDLIKKTGNKELLAEYVRNKSFDNDYYKKLILEYIAKSEKVKRSEIDNLVIPKLSEVLSKKQKKDKIRNFLFALGKEGKIVSREYATWEIKKD